MMLRFFLHLLVGVDGGGVASFLCMLIKLVRGRRLRRSRWSSNEHFKILIKEPEVPSASCAHLLLIKKMSTANWWYLQFPFQQLARNWPALSVPGKLLGNCWRMRDQSLAAPYLLIIN